MPKDYNRSERIGDLIQIELASIIPREIRDPRLTGLITVTFVEVSQNLAHANIFFTVFSENVDIKQTEEILNHAAGYIRKLLSQRIQCRTVPAIRFRYDAALHKANALSDLIDKAVQNDSASSTPSISE